ncbi:transcriptional regulator with XRE-family HTH domain [Bradyrhizobium sp. GM6.1]
MAELWNFGGVARRDGKLVFRTSNREHYDTLLKREGDTDIIWQKLPSEMSWKEAAEHLAQQPEFQSPEVLDCLVNAAETRGERLKRAREKRGLAILEVAEALGLSKEAVWGQEAYNRMPRDGKLAEYAALYRVSERWLREGGRGGPDDENLEHVAATPPASPTSDMTGAELLRLARKKLAAENRVDETCVSIDVSIRFGGSNSRAAA